MDTVSINYWAVLIAALVHMVLGALWYGPLFGKKWVRLSWGNEDGIARERMSARLHSYLWAFLAMLIMAYVLAHFALFMNVDTVSRALALTFWLWVGFIATIRLNSILWEGKPKELYVLDISYHFVGLLLMSLILALW